MQVLGEATLAAFSAKHPAARRPLARFLEIARLAEWPHFPAVKRSFAAAHYTPRTGGLVFDIGGNKYRLIARVDFEEQLLYIERIMTHEQYAREVF